MRLELNPADAARRQFKTRDAAERWLCSMGFKPSMSSTLMWQRKSKRGIKFAYLWHDNEVEVNQYHSN